MSTAQTHELRRALNEDVFYPPHPPRTASAEFERTRRHLIEDLDTPCWICGVRHSVLKDAEQNPCGASAMELHHFAVEWALAGAVDPSRLTPEFPDVIDAGTLQRFIDSPENGLVLCDVHHRHVEQGIHALTYPVWRAQRYVRQGYELTDSSRKGGVDDGSAGR